MARRVLRFALAALALAISARPVMAQTTTATLLGVVRDSTGAMVPDARITARNVLTGFIRSATTDGTGAYLIPNLPVGDYAVEAEKQGFRRFVREGVTLVVNQNARVDATLTVGAVSETVNVTGQPNRCRYTLRHCGRAC